MVYILHMMFVFITYMSFWTVNITHLVINRKSVNKQFLYFAWKMSDHAGSFTIIKKQQKQDLSD